MIQDSSKLFKGQKLKVNIELLNDHFPSELFENIKSDPVGILVGYKMVDGNQFGLVLQFPQGNTHWFFENELSEIT